MSTLKNLGCFLRSDPKHFQLQHNVTKVKTERVLDVAATSQGATFKSVYLNDLASSFLQKCLRVGAGLLRPWILWVISSTLLRPIAR